MGDSSMLHIDFRQPSYLVFERKIVRNAFVKIGQAHLTESRKLISRRDGSRAGDTPGYRTGLLTQSIGYYVPSASGKRPGFMVRIAPNQKKGKGRTASIVGAFYPAFLLYGVKRGAKRTKKHRKGAAGGSGWKIAPRKNYMTETLETLKPWTRYVLAKALRRALREKRF